MKNRNIKDYDYQVVVVRKEVAQELINNYECFGWVVISRSQHNRYENLIEVEMQRNHFINNKDDLQFLQVNMESDVVKRGRLSKTKNSKSTIFGITLAVISAILLTLSVLMLFKVFSYNSLVLGIISGVVGILCSILIPFICIKMVRKENILYAEKHEYYTQSISQYVSIAKEILGDCDEK